MRRCLTLLPLAALALLAGCNTVRGAGEDARSVGRVFTHHPNGPEQPR